MDCGVNTLRRSRHRRPFGVLRILRFVLRAPRFRVEDFTVRVEVDDRACWDFTVRVGASAVRVGISRCVLEPQRCVLGFRSSCWSFHGFVLVGAFCVAPYFCVLAGRGVLGASLRLASYLMEHIYFEAQLCSEIATSKEMSQKTKEQKNTFGG